MKFRKNQLLACITIIAAITCGGQISGMSITRLSDEALALILRKACSTAGNSENTNDTYKNIRLVCKRLNNNLKAHSAKLLAITIDSEEKFNSFLHLSPEQRAQIGSIKLSPSSKPYSPYWKEEPHWIKEPHKALQTLFAIAQTFPHLKKLSLYRCEELTAACGAALAQLQDLEELDLSRTNITDATLQVFAQACPHIKKLNLFECKELAAECGAALAQLRKLEELNLSRTNITAATLQAFASACPRIKKLNLSECELFERTEFAVACGAALARLPNLEELNVSFTDITDATLQVFAAACPRIKKLNLVYCIHLTTECGAALAHCHNLETLDVTETRIMPHVTFEDCMNDTMNKKDQIQKWLLKVKSYAAGVVTVDNKQHIEPCCATLMSRCVKDLKLSGDWVDIEVVKTMLLKIPQLLSLDLGECKALAAALQKTLQKPCIDGIFRSAELQIMREKMNEDCPFCLEKISEKPIAITSCGHIFHKSCLDEWFNREKDTCPNCCAHIRHE